MRTEARGMGTGAKAERLSGFYLEGGGHLFNVQEIFGLKVDSRALDGAFLIQHTTVADIGPHSKRHRFVLENLTIGANEGSLRAPLPVSVPHQQRAEAPSVCPSTHTPFHTHTHPAH